METKNLFRDGHLCHAARLLTHVTRGQSFLRRAACPEVVHGHAMIAALVLFATAFDAKTRHFKECFPETFFSDLKRAEEDGTDGRIVAREAGKRM